MVYRIYVEKKPGFDVEARNLRDELRENLGLQELETVRVFNRYDVEGIDQETYTSAKYTVFAEAPVDLAYDEEVQLDENSKYFAVEYLPGQYDQRADSAAQCITLINTAARAQVRYAKLIALFGNINEKELEAVKKYYINPVDSQEAALEKPSTLEMDLSLPEAVAVIYGFKDMKDHEVENLRREYEFAMSPADLRFVRDYFAKEDRDPTITELKVIDTYWSDHCRHTTFLTKITDVSFEASPYGALMKKAYDEYLEMRKTVYGDTDRDISLMDLAVIGTKYLKKKGVVDNLDESEEVNACSIQVTADIDGKKEDWLVMFKNETHNHPTEIEPFGGAATCLGGCIRDPLSGRAYVYQAMRVTGSGDPRTPVEKTLSGKLPQQKITKGAAKGYSSYGNQIGLATGLVDEIYHEGYVAKRMEVGAVIAAAPKKNVVRERPAPGDVVILVGGRTGRDGCGGATGSSKEHTEDSILTCGAEVQKGNPPIERNIQRLFRRSEVAVLIKRCNDFGAGGVSVAIGELADSLDVNLDLVLKKYEGLDGTELAISESQERMAVVVEEKNRNAFIAYAQEENLEAVAVATVTDTGRFRMFWRNENILDLSREFLNTNGVKQEAAAHLKALAPNIPEIGKAPLTTENTTLNSKKTKVTKEALIQSIESLNCCSKKGLIEMFDSTIGAGTVLMPLGGKNQLTPAPGMAAKLPVTEGDTNTVTLMSYGFDPELSSASPYHGALYAVIDSVTKITAMGGCYEQARLSFQEYFERLGTEAENWGKPLGALLGALKAQKELEIPSIGGKDSMSGTFMNIHVPPTLISFAVGVAEGDRIISPELKETDSQLVLVDAKRDESGIIDFEQYRKNMKAVQNAIRKGLVRSANTIGKGGIFISTLKMSVGNAIGISLKVPGEMLLAENYGGLLLEFAKDVDLATIFQDARYQVVGATTEDAVLKLENPELSFPLKEIIENWTKPLDSVFPEAADTKHEKEAKTISFTERYTKKPAISIAKPRVFIPAFPGTNCEMDSKRAFEKAGAIAQIHILRNLTQNELDASIKRMAAEIKQSQIIMIPGGFSGGDEPDGSAKFITAVFRNPYVKEAVEDLLENRDGLMLGICNGFQALIKLGLVPYGKILEQDDNSPTLTYNAIGRHVSRLVRTRIASVKSPWLANVSVGDVHTIPVSHGEGRFIANETILEEMIQNGQIATQYVNFADTATMDSKHNPNDSMEAVEGITSPDGRIFGKMGHSERIGKNLYKNVAGDMDQKLFASGVQYFK